jgi:surface protein
VLKKMFYNAGLRGRTSLAPLEGWDTTSVTDMSLMFYNIPSSVTRPSWYSE